MARAATTTGDLSPVVGRSVVVALVGYVFYGAAGGTPMEQPANWMFLGTLIVLAAFLHDDPVKARPQELVLRF